MTPQERQLVEDLFDRLARLESAPRDAEAERVIVDGLRHAPNAIYPLVQTVLVQDEALKRADARIRELTGHAVAVVVSDSFGRAWRTGTTDVALGVAGMTALLDLRGTRDPVGYELHATQIAVADEVAGAAELVMGKVDGVPAAIVRGLRPSGDGRGSDLVMPAERDLFR